MVETTMIVGNVRMRARGLGLEGRAISTRSVPVATMMDAWDSMCLWVTSACPIVFN